MTDKFARGLAGVAVFASVVALFLAIQGGNAPVDLAVVQPKFPGGIDVSSAGSTPGIVLNAESTGVPILRGLNASGTEVWKFTDTGVFIGPAAGGTPTP